MISKRIISLCISCFIVVACLSVKADADNVYQLEIYMEDMKCEQIDLQNTGILEDNSLLRGSDSIRGAVAAYSASVDSRTLDLAAGSALTFNCSYSPSSASMDFGVIDSNGRFYYINVKEGSINQTIRISHAGSYAVAIRNNSSQTVRVVGFVEY